MSIRVIDLNEEAKDNPPVAQGASAGQQGCPPALEPIEEEPKEEVIETPEIVNEVVEQTNEEVGKASLNSNPVGVEAKEEIPKPKPKPKPKASDIVPCPDCNKNMTYKNLRYSHKCSPEPKPVKPQAKPKAKQQPKPKPHEVMSQRRVPPEVYYSDSEEEEQTTHKPLSKPVRNQILKAQYINPQTALAQHYQLLQQQFIKQKQEKMNSLCQNMFSSKTKKR